MFITCRPLARLDINQAPQPLDFIAEGEIHYREAVVDPKPRVAASATLGVAESSAHNPVRVVPLVNVSGPNVASGNVGLEDHTASRYFKPANLALAPSSP